jgi:hypothetical protein
MSDEQQCSSISGTGQLESGIEMVTALNQIQGREGENFGMIEDFYYISPSSPASLSSVFSAVACTMDAVRPLTFPVHSLYPLQFLSVYALSLLLNLYRSADFCTYWPDACTMDAGWLAKIPAPSESGMGFSAEDVQKRPRF